METIRISGGYVPPNHNPHNPQAIKKWFEKLPEVYDLNKSQEADERHNFLVLKKYLNQ